MSRGANYLTNGPCMGSQWIAGALKGAPIKAQAASGLSKQTLNLKRVTV